MARTRKAGTLRQNSKGQINRALVSVMTEEIQMALVGIFRLPESVPQAYGFFSSSQRKVF